MKKILMITISFFLLFCVVLSAEITVKLGDLIYLEGQKDNQILGYGLVVGLEGTGDKKSVLTNSSLVNFLKKLGLDGSQIQSKNTAAVLITADLPAFARIGDRINITVSSIGDAKSLEGGILIQSPLKGADDTIYVVGQGKLSFPETGGRGKGVKTVSTIPMGGVVEKTVVPDFIGSSKTVTMVMKDPDYSLANRIIKGISEKYPDSKPELLQGGRIKVALDEKKTAVEFISGLEEIEINPALKARIVINERDGTIVSGGNVRLSEAIVSKEGLTIEIQGTDKKKSMALLKESSTVKDLVDTLNSINATTKDIIAVLKALRDAGSLHADLIVR